MPRRPALLLTVVAIGALAVAFRWWGASSEPFWIDEILSLDMSSGGPAQVLRAVAVDTHPPAYFLGLAAWRAVAGSSEAALRSYSAAWGVVWVLATGLLARALGLARGWAALAALLLAVNPLSIYYGQEARMYAPLGALVTLSAWCIANWIEAEAGGRNAARWAIGFGAASAVAIMTHYLGVLAIVPQGLAVLIGRASRRAHRAAWPAACALFAALLAVPWIAFVMRLRGAVYSAGHVGWIAPPTLADATWLLARDMLLGMPLPSVFEAVALLLALGVAAGAALATVGRRRSATLSPAPSRPGGVALAAWLLAGPLLLVLAASVLYHPVFYRHRFAVVLLAPALILLAHALARLPRGWRPVATIALLAVMVHADRVQAVTTVKQGLPGIAAGWRRLARPGDAVAFFPSYFARVADYYAGERLPAARPGPIAPGARVWVCTEPGFDERAQPPERAARAALLALGPRQSCGMVDGLEVALVTPEPRVAAIR